jgi:flavodoxin
LEKNWDHPLDIDYSDDVVGNFAFMHKNVLFISVNMVDAETEPDEVTLRLEQNVMWTKKKITEFEKEEYYALVIFGHAPPTEKQGEYFWPVIEQIKDIDKPVLYLHANSNGSFTEYTPFSEAENFKAVQLEKRGREAPMKVVVKEGGKFKFERRDPTAKE